MVESNSKTVRKQLKDVLITSFNLIAHHRFMIQPVLAVTPGNVMVRNLTFMITNFLFEKEVGKASFYLT